jgi:hypothetical protein
LAAAGVAAVVAAVVAADLPITLPGVVLAMDTPHFQ